MLRAQLLCASSLVLLVTCPAVPQQPSAAPAPQYMGRTIAQTMSYHGAGWLTRDERRKEERTDVVMQQLGLEPGMTVADIGCGNGYYTLRLAPRVQPGGTVIAVDIQPEMLRLLKSRADQLGAHNIQLVRGELDDPKLPADALDLVLLVDVYHEFSHPEEMLQGIRRALKPEGLVALLEYRGEDPSVPIKPLHKMTKEQIMKEYTANGFKLVREFDELPWQHMMFFGRDEAWSKSE